MLIDLAELTIDKAKALEGTTFDVALPDGTNIQMKLDEALAYETRRGRVSRSKIKPKRDAFAVYFLGPASNPVPQGMYTFVSENATLENVFVVPVAADDEVAEYEAVFT